MTGNLGHIRPWYYLAIIIIRNHIHPRRSITLDYLEKLILSEILRNDKKFKMQFSLNYKMRYN